MTRKTFTPDHKFLGAKIDLEKHDPRRADFPQRRVTYAVNERGIPIGEAHQRAKLNDADVELIRDIYEEGMVSYRILALAFGVTKAQIRNYVKFTRRATTPAGYRTSDASKRRPIPKSRLEQLGIDPKAIEAEDDFDGNH